MTETRPGFPWWIVGGAVLLAAAYLPTLATPFDFLDDGNLVYPSPGLSLGGHAALWWEKVAANVEHLGPFRPTLWVHWELFANAFGGDPFLWRLHRLLWCGLSAGMFLWFLRKLGITPIAALFAGAIAFWNPYRNEIWHSLTLAEGVAMPYALLGLLAARRAAGSPRPLRWELLSAACVLVALGCKNTFAALVPVQIMLRMWPDGLSLRDAWRRNGWRSLALAATLVMPAVHFVYFKLNWHPGQYESHGPTVAQAVRLMSALKGAVGLDFMAAGLVLALVAVLAGHRRGRLSFSLPLRLSFSPPLGGGAGGVLASIAPGATQRSPASFNPPCPPPERGGERRAALVAGLLLLLGGYAVYLPFDMMSGRYTLPAAWGLDVLVAVLLAALVAARATLWRKAAFVGLAAGLAAVMVAQIGKQEKFAARAKVLWEAVSYVEATALPNARLAWVGGDFLKGELDVEEGIHFQWHLQNRGRGDVHVGLIDAEGRPVPRIELPPLDGEADFRIASKPAANGWQADRSFVGVYWMGRKQYAFGIERRTPAPLIAGADAELLERMTKQFLSLSTPALSTPGP